MAYKQKSPQPVTEGGTGASTLTGVLTGNGTSSITANTVTQYGVLIGGASNAVSSTAVGTSGDVLTSNGAGNDPTFETPSGGSGSFVFISGQTASNSSSLDFTGLSTTYMGYLAVFVSIRAATDGAEFIMRTSTDNGSSFNS